jgi:hypothetical protein
VTGAQKDNDLDLLARLELRVVQDELSIGLNNGRFFNGDHTLSTGYGSVDRGHFQQRKTPERGVKGVMSRDEA